MNRLSKQGEAIFAGVLILLGVVLIFCAPAFGEWMLNQRAATGIGVDRTSGYLLLAGGGLQILGTLLCVFAGADLLMLRWDARK